ncbi:transglutaminase family protein [Allobranchiibius sp. GilTou73]|uniref:transglutaminase family protein n=1 Tax=Allobranchiibius sp. GilTou73 TaxID=2904523 RepID=UPI001F39C875|nr:transglutaminase family protein [Allobranchiibius sp. GilTou73]UIJ35702.1 transglutaminase family protein [Allobranchiibius sp. GilTou73]
MNTRTLDLGCTFRYSSLAPTAAVFQVKPTDNAKVTLSGESWINSAAVDSHDFRDAFGNTCTRLVLPQGITTFEYAVRAEVPDAPEDVDTDAPEISPEHLPDEVLQYTISSRFCQPDVLGTHAWRQFGNHPRGYGRVSALCSYVHEYLTYTIGSTNSLSTSVDAWTTGQGVCRDFAHLLITFCRALNIPARYVFGYMPDMDAPINPAPMDFHAWTQVWLGDRWWDFDARHDRTRKGRVVIGRGRDAADVALVTTYGAPWLQMMSVTAQESRATQA